MAYRAPNSLPVVLMMVVALAGSIAFARKPDNKTDSANVASIPQRAGDWKLRENIPLDENTMKQILADSYINRAYTNSAGQEVKLLVVYRRYGRREFAHRPELCFPAAGFTITRRGKITLPYAGQEIPAVALTAKLPNGYETSLAYFFASGKKTEENFLVQQVWMAFERLIPNKNGWTFIRLDSPTTTTSEDAVAAQKDFMHAFAPGIEAAITTDGKPTGPATAHRGENAAVAPSS